VQVAWRIKWQFVATFLILGPFVAREVARKRRAGPRQPVTIAFLMLAVCIAALVSAALRAALNALDPGASPWLGVRAICYAAAIWAIAVIRWQRRLGRKAG
jgi:hypothetical protein